jgi:hypothetical protein
MDLGEHFSLETVSRRLTGVDLHSRGMGNPRLLTAVDCYYMSIHDATTINDIDARKRATMAAQWDFEQGCEEIAASRPDGAVHTYEWDHWDTRDVEPWGNFANPGTTNPWTDWQAKPEDKPEVDSPRPSSDTSSALAGSGDESPPHTSVTTIRSRAEPEGGGGPVPEDTSYSPD